MAYIIGLTLVMQNIFWLTEGKRPTSRRIIKLAYAAYLQSDVKKDIHSKILNHVEQSSKFTSKARDTTLEKIEEILKKYRIDSAEMFALKNQIPFDILDGDEPWEA